MTKLIHGGMPLLVYALPYLIYFAQEMLRKRFSASKEATNENRNNNAIN